MEESINSTFIGKELAWFSEVIITRLKLYFNKETTYASIDEITPPPADGTSGSYDTFIVEQGLIPADRICLMLTFVPILRPQLFDCFNIKNTDTGQRFVEFGCIEGAHASGLLPTFETLLFILAGSDIGKKIHYINYFNCHPLFLEKKITGEAYSSSDSVHSSVLLPSLPLIEKLIKEETYSPGFSQEFPARRLTTRQNWDDLVLDTLTLTQVNEIKIWANLGKRMLEEWELKDKIKPGYRALFYGPSGTGKTFTATLLGKYTGKEVYCIDLSMVVSKYIGETEKKLSAIFDMAENKDWILFFDEADALFGKRTNIKDAHDRYANQEVSYLLQRIEDYDGLVLLSSNLKTNIDEAFMRRFQSIIHFSMPNAEQRERIWRNTFSKKTTLEPIIDLQAIARKYELSGGSILNVVRYCSLMTINRNSTEIASDDLIEGIRREFRKEGKVID
ncbi:hypothetical protein AGMMS50239_39480 [Bacteroidia bacterium]|nr:hypothetical protein AGMMS50239_39480 [Bacteroidia bacterium]